MIHDVSGCRLGPAPAPVRKAAEKGRDCSTARQETHHISKTSQCTYSHSMMSSAAMHERIRLGSDVGAQAVSPALAHVSISLSLDHFAYNHHWRSFGTSQLPPQELPFGSSLASALSRTSSGGK